MNISDLKVPNNLGDIVKNDGEGGHCQDGSWEGTYLEPK